MKTKHYIIPIFIPDLGCPNRCVFCNQKKITGKEQAPCAGEVRQTIKDYLATIPKNNGSKVEVAFYGGSFTAISEEEQRYYLEMAQRFITAGQIDSIRISTRPDKINDDILTVLMAYGVKTIELGVQSMDGEVLAQAKRGHTVEEVINAAELIKSWGFFLGIQLMIGLPGDSQEKALKTCEEVIKLRPDFVRIYPVLVLKNTELEEMYKKGIYKPWLVEQVVDTAKVMLDKFDKAGIEVIRIGLQNTDEIVPGGEVITGPYHPAIGELVYSALTLDYMIELIEKANLKSGQAKEIEFQISPKDESKVRGHKSHNIKILQERYDVEFVKIISEESLKSGELKLTSIDGRPVNYIIKKGSGR